MQIEITRFDHQGQGIGYQNNLITFVPKAVVQDILDIKIIKKKKNYQVGTIQKIIQPSPLRKSAFCPFYEQCGGCDLQNLAYEETLNYKIDKVQNILKRIDLAPKIEVIANETPQYYRNKITLKIKDRQIGFYKEGSHDLIIIDKCFIANPALNKIIPFIKTWQIKNGEVILRCNQNEEVLIIIKTTDEVKIDIEKLKVTNKIVGIVINNKCLYGDDFLIERINNLFFKISYDSFFQINPYVASKMFQLIKENIDVQDKVLDLYCGVGTLSLNAALKAQQVVGIEVVPNAILNAIYNAKINKLSAEFILNKVEEAITKIKLDFNTCLIDPPRKGLDAQTLAIIMKQNFAKIIYVSCDIQTLTRDLGVLKEKYSLQKFYILDMFSYTYHVECLCVLNLR